MTRPRKELVSVEDTPYYHVVSRCVRRSFLCGVDQSSGKDYEYRRQWIGNRMRILSSLFAIDLCAYAVLSNHFHIALKLCPEETENWTDVDVTERWISFCKGSLIIEESSENVKISPTNRKQQNQKKEFSAAFFNSPCPFIFLCPHNSLEVWLC